MSCRTLPHVVTQRGTTQETVTRWLRIAGYTYTHSIDPPYAAYCSTVQLEKNVKSTERIIRSVYFILYNSVYACAKMAYGKKTWPHKMSCCYGCNKCQSMPNFVEFRFA